jgi:hypothetical protein
VCTPQFMQSIRVSTTCDANGQLTDVEGSLVFCRIL